MLANVKSQDQKQQEWKLRQNSKKTPTDQPLIHLPCTVFSYVDKMYEINDYFCD